MNTSGTGPGTEDGSYRWRAYQSRRNMARYDRIEREAAARKAETLTVHVASESDPKLTYTLHVQGDEITCNCRGWNSHHKCKHATALRSLLDLEKAQ